MADCDNDVILGANPAQNVPNSNVIGANCPPITGGVGMVVTSFFDVNKMSMALQNFNAMNGVVNQMIGYDFKWFRAVPQQRSKDVIFQEYTLSNVEECPLEVKGVIPQGQVPDSKYTYDLMGLEYEVPFEIQMDKRYWEDIAGFGTAPQKKDIVYFTLENKLYEVESTYLVRGFMGQETTWKINLRKYSPSASRREGDALKQTIDQYTVSSEELFGTAVRNDIAKLVDDKQFSALNSTSQDKYKTLDPGLKTIAESISMYGTVIAQSYYDLQSTDWYNAVTYTGTDIISSVNNRAISAWFYPRTLPEINKTFDVQGIEPIISTIDPSLMYQYDASLYSAANYTITLKSAASLSDVQIDANVIVSRPGALNFYGKVVAISVNPLTYYVMINPFVLEDLIALSPNWNSMSSYKMTLKEPISILDGVNDFGDHVFSVNIFANQYIAINYGHTYSNYDAYVIRMPDKILDNKWYGIVVNIGNSWGQFNTYLYEKHETDKFAKLQNIFYETLKLYPENIGVDRYTINKSPAYLTNIRLFNETIEEEKQANELLSYFSKDGDKLIVGDNGDAKVYMSYITQQR